MASIFAILPDELVQKIFKLAIEVDDLPKHRWDITKPKVTSYKSLSLVSRKSQALLKNLYTPADNMTILLSFDNVPDLIAAHALSQQFSILASARYRLCRTVRNVLKEYEHDHEVAKAEVEGFIVAVHNVEDKWLRKYGLYRANHRRILPGFDLFHPWLTHAETCCEDFDDIARLSFPASERCRTVLKTWNRVNVTDGCWDYEEDDYEVTSGTSVLEGSFADLVLPSWHEIQVASDRVRRARLGKNR